MASWFWSFCRPCEITGEQARGERRRAGVRLPEGVGVEHGLGDRHHDLGKMTPNTMSPCRAQRAPDPLHATRASVRRRPRCVGVKPPTCRRDCGELKRRGRLASTAAGPRASHHHDRTIAPARPWPRGECARNSCVARNLACLTLSPGGTSPSYLTLTEPLRANPGHKINECRA